MGIKEKLINFKECYDNSRIYDLRRKNSIDENLVYFESRNGEDLVGNIFRIIEELSTGNYGKYKIVLYAKKEILPKINELKKNYNIRIDRIVTGEDEATEVLHKAKYIFTDSGIRPKFIKSPNQTFVNVWHGTPLKYMGVDNPSEIIALGHIQHSLLSADYLLYPNEFMCEKMLNGYMIEKIYPGKILFEGYPRNSVFFDDEKRQALKEKLGFEGKEIFVYMPTHRDVISERRDDNQRDEVTEYLIEIDSRLKDNQVLMVKLHVYNQSKIDFSKFSNIIPFPDGYEIYDIVNLADALISDYSSIFFDFANTRRKIVLFNYDEEKYLADRGIYIPLEELPFPKVQNVDDLISELNCPREYDDADFIERFCSYDRIDAARYICEEVFLNKGVCRTQMIENNNKNVLIFAGSLLNNGITSSLVNLLDSVDRERYNIFLTFKQWDPNIKENYETVFKRIPEGVEYLPIRLNLTPTLGEKLNYNKYFTTHENMECPDNLRNLFERSYLRQFGQVKFDIAIDFDGYNNAESLIFENAHAKNAIWVHNNMIQENRLKGKPNINIMRELYSGYDHVVVVSQDLVEPTSQIGKTRDNISVVHNIINYEKILANAEMDFVLDEGAEIYPKRNIEDIFKSSSPVFITIGRFSHEKGHKRLIDAFDEFCNDYEDAHLFIIGGYGILYEDIKAQVDAMKHKGSVTLIKGISNPMPILKRCDLFIFPSLYEGWGIVVIEADVLNVPVIATDIVGTQWIRDYDGHLVEDSRNGIFEGMHEFMEGKIGTLNIDYDEFNEMAVNEFYSIIDKE